MYVWEPLADVRGTVLRASASGGASPYTEVQTDLEQSPRQIEPDG